jgi:hypothetical protein
MSQNTSEIDSSQSNNQIFLHKADLLVLNNGWNDKNEKIIISIGENSASYKWMHERCSSYHKNIYTFTSILLIVLSSGLSIETFIKSDYVAKISTQIITYLATVTSVLQYFLKSEETGEKHLMAANEFSKLYHDIQQQMCMFRRDRINATKYVSDCLKLYDSLIINNPDINSYVLKKFKKTFKNSDISLPDIADKIQKIEIITENQSYNIKNIDNNSEDYSQDISNNFTNTITNTHLSNNLASIHNAFQIHGDFSDKDLENINYTELQQIKNKLFKYNYEYERFLQHSHEKD